MNARHVDDFDEPDTPAYDGTTYGKRVYDGPLTNTEADEASLWHAEARDLEREFLEQVARDER